MKGQTAIGSHQSGRSLKEEWLTPPFILKELGPFDLDPCAADPRPWDTASMHYSIYDNGLAKDWHGRVWLNPPYGRQTGKWLARMALHGFGTALIFARTETTVWHNYVWYNASGILFFHGRLHFHHPDGRKARSNAGGPSALIAYGQYDNRRLAQFRSKNGKYIDLTTT